MTRYYIENANPPIISREQFSEVQNLWERRQKHRAAPTQYPLTGKIHCSCGRTYTLVIINSTRYWECNAHNQHSSSCDSRRIPERDIYKAFIDMVNKLRLMRQDILGTAMAQVDQLRKMHSGMHDKIHEIDRQIAELNGQNLVLARLRTKQILSSGDYATQSNTISQKVCLLRQERRKLLNQDENIECLDALTGLDNILSLTDCQTSFNEVLFEQIVVKITAPSHTSIRFELLGGLKLTMPIPPQRRREG